MSPNIDVSYAASLLLAILIVGLVVLFAKLGRKGRIAMGTVVLGVVVLGALTFVRQGTVVEHRYPLVRQSDAKVTYYYQDAPGEGPTVAMERETVRTLHEIEKAKDEIAAHTRSRVAPPVESATQTPWPVEADPKFKPDIYPSASSALRGVAADVAEQLSTLFSDGEHPSLIRLSGVVDLDVLDIVATALRNGQSASDVVIDGIVPKPLDQFEYMVERVVSVGVSVTPTPITQALDGRLRQISGGKVEMEATHATARFTRRASFIEKPWVDSFAEFASRDPKRRWFVGRSPSPHTSPSDAELGAIRDAARALLPEACIEAKSAKLVTYAQSGAHPEVRRQLEQIIERELLDRQYVVDRFVQSFQRPYGRVWSAAVLVDASPENLETLGVALRQHHRAERQAWAHTALSVGGLLLLICLVYLFLNAATKGYYVWMLRVGAVAVVVVGIVAVLFIA